MKTISYYGDGSTRFFATPGASGASVSVDIFSTSGGSPNETIESTTSSGVTLAVAPARGATIKIQYNESAPAEWLTDANGNPVALRKPDGSEQRLAPAFASRRSSFGVLVNECSSLTGMTTAGTGTISLVPSPVQSAILGKAAAQSIAITVAAGNLCELVFPLQAAAAQNPTQSFSTVVELVEGVSGTTSSEAIAVSFNYDSTFANGWFSTMQLTGHGVHVIAPSSFSPDGTPNVTTMRQHKVRFAPGSVGGTLIVHGMWAAQAGPSMVSIIHDDATVDAYTELAPRLARYGWRGGFAIIDSLIGAGAGYLSANQLRALRDDGHVLMPHGASPASSFATAEQALADIDANQAFLRNLGCWDGIDCYVYPQGVFEFSAADRHSIRNGLAARGYRAAWQASGSISHVMGGVSRYNLTRVDVNETSTIANVLAGIDNAVTRGRNIWLMLHRVVASGATGTDITRTKLDELLDGLRTRELAGTLRVASPTEQLTASGL